MVRYAILVLLWLFTKHLVLHAQDTGSLTTAQLIGITEPSLVNLTFYNETDEVIGYSTGFFVSNNTVITSYKLFSAATKSTITDYTNNVYTVLARINDLPEYDLTLVKVNYTKGKALPISEDITTAGSTVYAVSTMPGAGFTFSISSGKLIQPEMVQDEISLVSFQLNNRVSGIGAALLNSSGQLIGVINTNIAITNNNSSTLLALHTKHLNQLMRRNIIEPEGEEVEEPTQPIDTEQIIAEKKQKKEKEPKPEKEEKPEKAAKSLLKNYGGPVNSLYSIAVPGLGNYKVRKNQPYWIISVVSLGAVGYGIFSKYKASDQYNSYKIASTQEKIDDYYTKANRNHLIGSYAITVGGTIWLADIVNVAIKGFRNKQKHR